MVATFTIATLVFDRHTPEGAEFFRHLPWFLLYANNWVIALGPERVIFAFSWSLATEEQFYIFWPSVLRFSRRRWVPIAVIAGLMVGTWTMQALLAHALVTLGEVPSRVVTSIAPAICMGCLLAFALHDRKVFNLLALPLSWRWPPAIAALAVLMLPAFVSSPNAIRLAMAALVAGSVVSQQNVLKPLLENRLVRHVGVVSYGIYLMFTLVLNVGTRLFRLNQPWQRFCWTLPITALVATVVYRYYETPFLRLKSRFSMANATAEPLVGLARVR
jgi:peptidoglycan/LPS O-acetylase OafA/YrhL